MLVLTNIRFDQNKSELPPLPWAWANQTGTSSQLTLRLSGSTETPHSRFHLETALIVHGALWQSSTHKLCLSLDPLPSEEFPRECDTRRAGPFDAAVYVHVPRAIPFKQQWAHPLPQLSDYGSRLGGLARALKILSSVDVCRWTRFEVGAHTACQDGRRHGVAQLMISLNKEANKKTFFTNMLDKDWLPIAASFVAAAITLPQPFVVIESGNLCGGTTVMLALLKRIFCPDCPFLSVDPGFARQAVQQAGKTTGERLMCAERTLAWAGLQAEVEFVHDFSGTSGGGGGGLDSGVEWVN